VSPLVALSVSAAVISSLETNTEQRLAWLDEVLKTVDVTVCIVDCVLYKKSHDLT
jgi:hypothetical protein